MQPLRQMRDDYSSLVLKAVSSSSLSEQFFFKANIFPNILSSLLMKFKKGKKSHDSLKLVLSAKAYLKRL